MNLMNLFKRNPEKQRAIHIANQSAQMYDHAVRKGGHAVSGRTNDAFRRRNKIKGKHSGQTSQRTEPRQKKEKYKPGKLGPSMVSQEIKKEYAGTIQSRSNRRMLAKYMGVPTPVFYNGPTYFRVKGRKAK